MVYIESVAFTARLHRLAGASALDVLSRIQTDLSAPANQQTELCRGPRQKNPERGDLVQGLGGIRKARIGNPARGKGTRGGYRYLFLYLENRGHIHLLFLLDKDEQVDLSNEERKALRALVTAIKQSGTK